MINVREKNDCNRMKCMDEVMECPKKHSSWTELFAERCKT